MRPRIGFQLSPASSRLTEASAMTEDGETGPPRKITPGGTVRPAHGSMVVATGNSLGRLRIDADGAVVVVLEHEDDRAREVRVEQGRCRHRAVGLGWSRASVAVSRVAGPSWCCGTIDS